ncbi:MAG: cytochrome d ubiquinol oxidase subunit II [Proteobacteria bacterium]|nr:cytochrome d ubiquinol oxidase subunit II [Pseudomonadota bacterium]
MEWLGSQLPSVWLGIIAFFLLYYAVTDGFDLGIGILSLLHRDEETVGAMMGTVSHVWAGNQTWLVILGGMLFGAFPLFYGLLLSSLYIPMVAMLFGLLFRGVAFEFRGQSTRRRVWDLAFGGGSLLATLAQGFALGGLLGGLPVENGTFVGGVWHWLTPYSALVAAGVLSGYVMLGANYLVWQAEGELRRWAYRCGRVAALVTLPLSAGVHLWTTARYPYAAQKWGAWPEALALGTLLVLSILAYGKLLAGLWRDSRRGPLLWNAAVILFSFAGLSLALFPHMIPSVVSPVTVAQAAASPKTLEFMLVATAVLLPVILVYTGYTYRITSPPGQNSGKGYGG